MSEGSCRSVPLADWLLVTLSVDVAGITMTNDAHSVYQHVTGTILLVETLSIIFVTNQKMSASS